jgi:short-subunit dehydrogenase
VHEIDMTLPSPTRPLALVTGASSGMGAAFARRLAARGYDVALVARRADRLEALAAETNAAHGVRCLVIPLDLSGSDAHERVLAALAGRPVEVLVNNAGYSLAASFAETDWPTQRDCVMTLVMAVCALTHAVLPAMLAAGRGRIITTSSLLALSQGGPGHTVYPAAKSFVLKFMLSLHAEVGRRGVRITCVLPGSTASEFQSANGTEAAMRGMPSAFIATVDQVVDAALAASDRGQLMVIPGWYNRVAAVMFRLLPDGLQRWAATRASNAFASDAT